MRYSAGITCLFSIALVVISHAHAASEQPAKAELEVTLFGQPCVLSGPFDQNMLRSIHAISPDQALPILNGSEMLKPDTLQKLKNSSAKVGSIGKLPPTLDPYRERLLKRLEAFSAFAAGLQGPSGNRKSDALFTATEPFLRGRDSKPFAQLVRKLQSSKEGLKKSGESLDQLFEVYSELIISDPEEEFHRGIQKIGVKYGCSFEESGDSSEETKNKQE